MSGLAAGGRYGVSYSLNSALIELGIQTATAGGQLDVSVPAGAVMTVYPYAGADLAPEVYKYAASPAFLKVGAGTATTLTAAATDPELDAMSYAWTVGTAPAGARVTFGTPAAAATSANGLTVAGLYTFDVKVSDGQKSSTEEVGLNVFNGDQPPIIQAVQSREPTGVPQPTLLTLPQSSVRLWDQGSYDLENDTLSRTWTVVSQPAGANATLAAETDASPAGSDVASNLTVAGKYTFQLSVFDGTNTEVQDLTVTVDPADAHAPTIANVIAGLVANGHGRLSATTADADGDYLVNWWDVVSQPDGSTVTFDNQASPTTGFSVDRPGIYTFQLSTVDRALSAQSQVVRVVAVNIASVPEPTTTAWAVAAAMLLLRRGRRGRGTSSISAQAADPVGVRPGGPVTLGS